MRITTSILAISILLLACNPATRQASDQVEPKTTLRVENQNFLDMKIYILRGAERIRIGTVTGNSTQVFVIPESYVVGASSLQFLADPIGSNKMPISQELSVHPGEQIELIITN